MNLCVFEQVLVCFDSDLGVALMLHRCVLLLMVTVALAMVVVVNLLVQLYLVVSLVTVVSSV